MAQQVRLGARRFPAAVVWGLVALGFANFGLAGLMEWTPRLKDPEYGIKLARLRRALAAAPATRPLVLLLGNSRVGTGVRPHCLKGDGPELNAVVYNFGVCASGPVLQLMCLKRLLADGIRPDWLLLEVWQPQLVDIKRWTGDVIETTRLQARDLRVVARYHSRPSDLYLGWTEAELAPWWSHRMVLFNQFAPRWLDAGHRIDTNWRDLDSLGWLHIPRFQLGPESPGWLDWTKAVIVAHSRGFSFQGRPICAEADSAIREMLTLCQRHSIASALILMPDRFLPEYTPEARKCFNDYVNRLNADFQARVFDMRNWVADTSFHDGVHQTPQSAAVFSARMGREVIRPLLAEPALARRSAGP